MSKVLKRLKHEGVEITEELLAGLSPYRSSHINFVGTDNFDATDTLLPWAITPDKIAKRYNAYPRT